MKLRLSIKLRLLATLVVLGVLLVITGVVGLVGIQTSNEAVKQAYSNDVAAAISLGNSILNLTITRTTLDRALLHPEAPDAAALIDKADSYLAISNAAWQAYNTLPRSDEEAALAQAAGAARADILEKGIRPLMAAMKQGDRAEADRIAMSVIPLYTVPLTKASAALDKFRSEQGKSRYAAAQDRYTFLLTATAVAISLGLLACVACGFNLFRAISRPLGLTLRHFEKIASGDMTDKLHLKSGDEMEQLGDSVASMQTSIASMVGQITRGTEAIVSATRQIAAGNGDLSQRTEEQAASLQQTAASMEELTATVKQNADNAREAQALTGNANEIASRGATVVGNVVETMGEIDRSSQKIADITGVIESIAFQTNILALNAAVEAARAGDEGRGFAVVAGEVRSLAQRAGVAAREIKELIGDSVERVNAGARLVGTAGETMAEIRQAISRVAAIMNEIAAASDEQRDGIEQVSLAVSQMDEVSQQNAALVEEAAAAAAALDEQAHSLRRAVSVFRLAS